MAVGELLTAVDDLMIGRGTMIVCVFGQIVDEGRSWETLLHIAVRAGRRDLLEWLRDQPGLQVDCLSGNHETARQVATQLGVDALRLYEGVFLVQVRGPS